MTDLPLVSASQLTLFTECQRKWGFKYLERIETPPHPGALLGTETHHQLGAYLTRNQPLDFTRPSGEIAQALVPLLPAPLTPGLVVERKFTFPSSSGTFGYVGYIDMYVPSDALGLGTGSVLVGDFKTTSNLKYAKSEEVLKTDFQAQLYATAVVVEEAVDELDLVWFTVRTRGAHRAQRAHLHVGNSHNGAPSVPIAHVVEQFDRIDAIAKELVALKLAKPSVQDLPPNPHMCDQYGGCPFRNRCNLSPAVMAAAINKEAVMNSSTNSFLDRLKKTTATPTVEPTEPTRLVEIDTSSGAPIVAINPPESALPPAPAIGVAETTPVKKRGRPAKTETGPVTAALYGFPRSVVAQALREIANWLETAS